MGSNLSPLLADLFINNIETNFFAKHALFSKHIVFWARYVDDVFAIFKGTQAELSVFNTYINSVHPNIRFTFEVEVDKRLPFLDMEITRLENRL